MKNTRIEGLDILRGWAIILMICFHLAYDLNYFNFIEINLKEDVFWIYFRLLIVGIFLFSVGISLALLHKRHIKWQKIYHRTLILGLASLLISLVTYLQFPHRWVYFGILHFVLFASWAGLLFIPYPKSSLFVSILIFIGFYLGILETHTLFIAVKDILHLPQYTEDLVRFFPWFAVVLLGISFVGFSLYQRFFSFIFFDIRYRFNTYLAFLGRHTLIIYLTHQAILFGLIMALSKIL